MQNSQEKFTCARVSFLGLRLATLLNKRLWRRCFPLNATLLKKKPCNSCFPANFAKFLRTPFCRTPPGDCFCTSAKHKLYDSQSTRSCVNCKEEQRTCIIEKNLPTAQITNSNSVTYPVHIIKFKGITCCEFKDTRSGVSYVSTIWIWLRENQFK